MKLTNLTDDALIALANMADFATGLVEPTLRLGVTGLSRSGKTVFITALVHNLVHGGRLPLFEVAAEKRLARACLADQPDPHIPRFEYERHVSSLVDGRTWPEGTRRISELRLTVEYGSSSFMGSLMGGGRLTLDIVDYPGEWLLDLPLLGKDYATFAREALTLAREPARAAIAGPYLARVAAAAPGGPEDEVTARELADAFKAYLRAGRADEHALSTLPPGRFLMPGDLDGSPALTFAPVEPPAPGALVPERSLYAMMARRYDAYLDVVVRKFFREHFARLDRQIVLVDALQAMNAGPAAVRDLETALADILACFRPGRGSWLGSVLTRRIDRILFAATKADHLPRTSHDRLEKILGRLVGKARERAEFAGAEVAVTALAAVRATREVTMRQGGEELPAIVGVPVPGETIGATRYDGETEIALFPGDLPADPESVLKARSESEDELDRNRKSSDADLRFLRFRPPRLERGEDGVTLSLPHIRLDKALQFLLGDKLA